MVTMTKKETTKQPRDGNGKFAKMIKIEDKFGNAAYFTPEEMAGFKATPQKNPDCEPATKGYVKSLITLYHEDHSKAFMKHRRKCVFCDTVVWGIILVLSTVFYFSLYGNIITMCAILISAAFIFNHILDRFNWIDTNSYLRGRLKFLNKYNPPRRGECEEED